MPFCCQVNIIIKKLPFIDVRQIIFYDYALNSEKVMAAELTQAWIIRLNICGFQKRRLNR
jgi:hypothetical protein